MNIDLEGIKDAVYELEGLLELAELREDKLPSLFPLMKNKLKIINAFFDDCENDEADDEYDADAEDAEEEFESEARKEIDPESAEEIATDAEEEAEAEEAEESAEAKVEPQPYVEEEEKKPAKVIFTETETVTENYNSDFDSSKSVPKPAFCINDRFRFRRELFGNSDAEFNATMDHVVTMDDYEEAEDYFLGDLGWDIENPEVADFMSIIRNYFEK